MAPDANPNIVMAVTSIGNYILTGFEINKNANRLAIFLGQIAHETSGFKYIVENGNYSQAGLLNLFPEQFDPETAKNYAHQPEKILNRAYANHMGNGPESSGDGWRFRGRGFFMISYRANYVKISKETGINLIDNPELASDPNVALLIAATYWYNNKLNALADEGNIVEITKRFAGGGPVGLEDRKKYAATALSLLTKK